MVFAAVPAIKQAIESDTSSQSQAAAVESSIQKQIKGFELVLQREPENKTALEGLVRLRLALKDEKGAIAPLEKLVKLEPERGDYKVMLERLQKGEQSNQGVAYLRDELAFETIFQSFQIWWNHPMIQQRRNQKQQPSPAK